MTVLLGDWGTTRLRAWVVDDSGEVRAQRTFPIGVSQLASGEAANRLEQEVRPALNAQGLACLLCGMVGSNLGWTPAGYVDCPTSLDALARGLTTAAPGARIVPGLRCAGLAGPDVMRGEETQLLGWLAGQPARMTGVRLVCLPGTHAKWALLVDGRIERFVTAMTGELFALLAANSTLASREPIAATDGLDGAAFDQGVDAAGDGGAMTARLFNVRGRVLAGDLASEDGSAFLSGLLIGGEIAALFPMLAVSAAQSVDLVGDRALCRWYSRAMARRGISTEMTDGETAALAGLKAIWRQADGLG